MAAVYGNRNRLKSGFGKEAMRKRCEIVERSFAHVLERGGMRRAWLRGRENVHKRHLVHVAGYNLGILMRALFGSRHYRTIGRPPPAIIGCPHHQICVPVHHLGCRAITFAIIAGSDVVTAALIVDVTAEAA
jgi:hypothetical protein